MKEKIDIKQIKFNSSNLDYLLFYGYYLELDGSRKQKHLNDIYKIYCYLKLYYDVFPSEKYYDKPLINLINPTLDEDKIFLSRINYLKNVVESLSKNSELLKKVYMLNQDINELRNIDSFTMIDFNLKKFGLFKDIKRKMKFLSITNIDEIKKQLQKKPELYFLLDDKLKSNYEIVEVFLKNAKYRSDNYGEVFKYVKDPSLQVKLKRICKINGYCDLYFFKKGLNPFNKQLFNLDVIGNNILNKSLLEVDKMYNICETFDELYKQDNSDLIKVIDTAFGINDGKKNNLDYLLYKYPDVSKKDIKRVIEKSTLKYLKKKTSLINNVQVRISALVLALSIAFTSFGVMMTISKKKEKNLKVTGGSTLEESITSLPSDISNFATIDAILKKYYSFYNEDSTNECEFIRVKGFNDDLENKIKELKSQNKKIGLILDPGNFYQDTIDIIGKIAYYITKYGIDLPILYYTSSVENTETSCKVAKQILEKLSNMGCYVGLYGNKDEMNDFIRVATENKILNPELYDKMIDISSVKDLSILNNYNFGHMISYQGKYYFDDDLINIIKENNLNSRQRALMEYEIKDNDFLEDISKKFSIPVQDIFELNNISELDEIIENNKILVPSVENKRIENSSYNDEYLKGIDVSGYNAFSDWKTMKEQGLDFAIIKFFDGAAINEENEECPFELDTNISHNIQGCIDNSIPTSFYYLCNTGDSDGMLKEAKYMIDSLQNNGIYEGTVFLDIEIMRQEWILGDFNELEQGISELNYNGENSNLSSSALKALELRNKLSNIIKLFEYNNYNLMFYTSYKAAKIIHALLPESEFWVTQHETYNKGAVLDENGIPIFGYYSNLIDFSEIDNLDEWVFSDYKSDEIGLIQYCEYGYIDGNENTTVDLDFARKDIVNTYFNYYDNEKRLIKMN